MSGSGGNNMQNLIAQNANARAAILGTAVDATQLLQSVTVATPGSTANILSFQPRPVGIIKGFWVRALATVNNSGNNPLTRTPWGGSNLISNFLFNDVFNYQRINTLGLHLFAVNTAKTQRPFATVFADTSPIGFGDNFGLLACPAVIAAGQSGVVEWWWWVPLSYGNTDMRGAIFANLVNATMLLQLTINPQPIIASTGDATQALYTGVAAAGSITTITVEVWQNYWDQLPFGGQMLPTLDMSWIYELKFTSLTGLSAGMDFPITFSNFRNFQSLLALYDNGGQSNNGTDINSWALQSANLTNLFKISPRVAKVWERQRIETEFPPGSYYFDFRARPIASAQFGNMQLVLNPSVVNAGAQVIVGYEDLGMAGTIIPAGSLPAG